MMANPLASALARAGIPEDNPELEQPPAWRVIGESKIPVSSAHGALWKARCDTALKLRRTRKHDEDWDTAIRYYQNNQVSARVTGDMDYSQNYQAEGASSRHNTTENLVYANTAAMVPSLYLQNPRVEVTAIDPDDEDLAITLERLVNTILDKRASPGVALKGKAKRAVVTTTLCNLSYLVVDWTFREQSSEQALEDLERVSVEYTAAKTTQEIREAEGKLEALTQRVALLDNAGPTVRFKSPFQVIVDSDSTEADMSDAKWIRVDDYVSTEWLKAMFMEENNGQYTSLFNPTHVVPSTASPDECDSMLDSEYIMLDDTPDFKKYGYETDMQYRQACRTRVAKIYDKTTRRLYMYNTEDWSWPIWVWEDRLQLQGYFNVFPLTFVIDPIRPVAHSETSYYLDQQDQINEVNSEAAKYRKWLSGKVAYDTNAINDKSTIQQLISANTTEAIGIDLPEGQTLDKVLSVLAPPSINYREVFDKGDLYQAIDRISSVMPIMRGAEFRTNTNTTSVQTYNQQQQTRLSERTDAIEDLVGQVGWAIGQLCLMNYTRDDVVEIIGESQTLDWRLLSPQQIRTRLQAKVVGGSGIKPNSPAKQQQALDIAQVLGQFVNVLPAPVILVILDMFRKAFDNVVITDEQWRELQSKVETAMQQQQQPTSDEESEL